MEHFNSEPTSSSDVTPAQTSAISPVGNTDAAIMFLKAMHPSTPGSSLFWIRSRRKLPSPRPSEPSRQ